MARLKNLLISLDQFLFSIVTLGNAAPDETASAAAWRLELTGKWQGKIFRPLIDGIFFFEKGHCEQSFNSEVNRKQLPSFYQ